jgi:hypothetical protein
MRNILILFTILLSAAAAHAQTLSLSGKVIDGMTLKPVSFALIIVKEAGLVTNTKKDGTYSIEIKKPGSYTLVVQSQGLQTLSTTVTVNGAVNLDLTLNPFVSRNGGGLTVRGDRDIQRISRQTMTKKEIKEVPATFGDSVGALASLPGVNRTGGIFGPLIIRGADYSMNGYYIDDIPMFKLQHFGGIHSVISNDLMESIDLYSSAFPSQFGNAQASVININTVDEVKKAGGHADMGIISANAYFEAPILKETYIDGTAKEENMGYIIGAGRYGYLTVFIPFFYKHVMHQDLSWLPEYWDYQFKTKYNFNRSHALTFLAFGSKDKINLSVSDLPVDDSMDPLMMGLQMYNNDQSYNQGLYYTYTYSPELILTSMCYASLSRSTLWFNVENATQEWMKDLGINSDPNIYGVKQKVRLEWWKNHAVFRGAAEATIYNFKTKGKTITTTSDSEDIGKDGLVQLISLGKTYTNETLSGYAENKFTFGGLIFTPGVHIEHLVRTKTTVIDPRGLLSFTFPTQTTIGVAGGYYSAFLQTNPEYFQQMPNLAAEHLKPQKSIHRSLSIEQQAGIYTFKAEGFYNDFTDLVVQDAVKVGSETVGIFRNAGEIKTYGVELLAKIKEESDQGLFGWASYTWNRSSYIQNQSELYSKDYGRMWLNSPYDMPHVVKIVAGYTVGRHTLSSKFQYNSAVPYTAITGSTADTDYTLLTGKPRNVPEYGKPYTERLDPEYRLDLRYSYKRPYSWGYITWYVEAIGLVSSPSQEYKWDYRYSYESGKNPRVVKNSSAMTIVPNFGVEVKF